MAIIGVALLFAGCFAFTFTWNAEPRDIKSAVFSLILVVGGAMIAIGGSSSQGMVLADPTKVGIGAALSVISLAMLAKPMITLLKKRGKKEDREKQA